MITIKKHPHKIKCDLCTSRDTLTIAKTGIGAYNYPVICCECLKKLVHEGIKFFGIETEPPEDMVNLLKLKDLQIKQMETRIRGLKDKPVDDLGNLSRRELLTMAKKFSVSGKLATMKTSELIKKIREAQT